jgi:hypothetical protein
MIQKEGSNNLFRFLKSHIVIILFVFILICFSLFSSFIAMKLKRAIIPDEPAHIILSHEFASSWTFPEDSPRTYPYGPIGYSPYLYYWINGRALGLLDKLIPDPGSYKQLVFLRFISVFYSVITLIFSYLLANEVIKKPCWNLLSVFLLANTMMFLFLSGGVSYDNLANMLSIGSVYFFVRVVNKKDYLLNSIFSFIFILMGTLVKITLLPLFLIIVLIWGAFTIKNHVILRDNFILKWKLVIPFVILLGFLILNFNLYGMNLINFGRIKPKCSQVMDMEKCNLSPFVARSAEINLREKLTFGTILSNSYPDPVEYVLDFWIKDMMEKTYGFFGHKKFIPDISITFFRLFYLWVFLVIIRTLKKPSFIISSLWMITIFYTIVLFRTNYDSEMITGFKHVAIQGRYLFPIIGIFYTSINFHLSELNNRYLRKTSYLISIILFMFSGPILYLLKYNSVFCDWFIRP